MLIIYIYRLKKRDNNKNNNNGGSNDDDDKNNYDNIGKFLQCNLPGSSIIKYSHY